MPLHSAGPSAVAREELVQDRVEDRRGPPLARDAHAPLGQPGTRSSTVPSSGSTTQRRPDVPPMSSPSSPMIASSGARRARISRIAASAARSAALTRSVDVDFVANTRSLPKRLEQQRTRGARRLDRDVEQRAVVLAHAIAPGRRSIHGRAASIWAASDSSTASSPRRPTSWTPTGSPSSSNPRAPRLPAGR